MVGAPGTGKTYQGAEAIFAAICAGRRVGIAAMSHAAIDNLLEAVVERFAAEKKQKKLKHLKLPTR